MNANLRVDQSQASRSPLGGFSLAYRTAEVTCGSADFRVLKATSRDNMTPIRVRPGILLHRAPSADAMPTTSRPQDAHKKHTVCPNPGRSTVFAANGADCRRDADARELPVLPIVWTRDPQSWTSEQDSLLPFVV